MNRACRSVILLTMTYASVVCAYETETHAVITAQAFNDSVLSPTSPSGTLTQYGFDRLDPDRVFSPFWQVPIFASGVDQTQYFDEGGIDRGSTSIQFLSSPSVTGGFEHCQMREILAVGNGSTAIFQLADVVEDPGVSPTTYSLANWLVRGAIREDDLGFVGNAFTYPIFTTGCGLLSIAAESGPANEPRVINHFYDPIYNTGLFDYTFYVNHQKLVEGINSVDWALGYINSFYPIQQIAYGRSNHFTYEDARDNLWWGLTRESGRAQPPYTDSARTLDSAERFWRFATTFRALGDVVHLLEDTAQPQHTRNDYHGPFSAPEAQAFEAYTNARVLHNPVVKNVYIQSFFDRPLSVDDLPVVPISGNYPIASFSTPTRFFSTRDFTDDETVLPDDRYGLADYSNRGFFTASTLPGLPKTYFYRNYREPGDPSVSPGYTYDSTHACAGLMNSDPRIKSTTTCGHFEHAVQEALPNVFFTDTLPTGFQMPNVPVAALSAFSAPSIAVGVSAANSPTYAMGLEEFQATANLALPRAVGYATGLINFFFRGSIEVDAPDDGLIGIMDDSAPHGFNDGGYACDGSDTSDGCTQYGFKQIRLNIRNSTADIVESVPDAEPIKQLMVGSIVNPSGTNNPPSDATLLAVARYHRNPCYVNSLLGEVTINQKGVEIDPTCPQGTRTQYQEISVSAPLVVPATQLNSDTALPQIFDFSTDPIPVNATDLFIQVVYRGALGDEIDGIAVGTLDVAEANYYSFWNNTDWYDLNHVWVTPAYAATQGISDSGPIPTYNLRVCFNGSYVFSGVTGTTALAPAQFYRLAMLTVQGEDGSQRMGTQTLINGATYYSSAYAPVGTRQGKFEDDSRANYLYKTVTMQQGRGVVIGAWRAIDYQYTPDGVLPPNPYDLSPTLTGPITGGTVLDFGNANSFCQ